MWRMEQQFQVLKDGSNKGKGDLKEIYRKKKTLQVNRLRIFLFSF